MVYITQQDLTASEVSYLNKIGKVLEAYQYAHENASDVECAEFLMSNINYDSSIDIKLEWNERYNEWVIVFIKSCNHE